MIPSSKPKLPEAAALLPYLQIIDENRYYSNFGPLVKSLEARFASWIGVPESNVVTSSNGTTALELAIAAHNLPRGDYILMPSWTFAASAHAVLSCGLKPFFVDVEEGSWAVTPDIARAALPKCPGTVALAMPVAPFGMPLPLQDWEDFAVQTGIEVVIDGAAMSPLDVQVCDHVTTTLSLHATKLLCAGEGGLIISRNQDVVSRAREISNFDLTNSSGISVLAGNKKMSEYHAAVAHASMDEWRQVEHDFMRVAKRYRSNLATEGDVKLRPHYGESAYYSVCLVEARVPFSTERMSRLGVGIKNSWRAGCHKEPFFATAARTKMQVTDRLAQCTTGLPCYRDLSDEEIDFVCEAVLHYVRGSR